MKVLLALLALASSALASDLDFVLVNETSRDYEAVYITAKENKDWDGNLFANGAVLAPGASVAVKFPASARGALWDIKLVDDAGLSVSLDDVDLAGADKVTLREKGGKISAVVE